MELVSGTIRPNNLNKVWRLDLPGCRMNRLPKLGSAAQDSNLDKEFSSETSERQILILCQLQKMQYISG